MHESWAVRQPQIESVGVGSSDFYKGSRCEPVGSQRLPLSVLHREPLHQVHAFR